MNIEKTKKEPTRPDNCPDGRLLNIILHVVNSTSASCITTKIISSYMSFFNTKRAKKDYFLNTGFKRSYKIGTTIIHKTKVPKL